MAEGKRASRSSELLLPPQGAGVDFVRRELTGPVRLRGPRTTFRIENSSVLSRVREFLPQLAAAETQLQEMVVSSGSPSRVDIENISEDEPHIAMDLAVFPLAGDEEETRGHSSSSSSSESDGEEEEGMVAGFQLKLPGRRRKTRTPGIEELPCR